MEINKVYCMDAIEFMKQIDDNSIDMVLVDLPYGTTACSWDEIIPLNKLWKEFIRITKDDCAMVFTASQPFTSKLVMSNIKMFKYEWIWEKAVGSNFATLKYQPMKEHENILVFCKTSPKYFPIKQKRKGSGEQRVKLGYKSNTISGDFIGNLQTTRKGETYGDLRYPSSVQFFNNREKSRGLHPTQKPLELFKYLIKTYTEEGNLILDCCIGSGTTALACKQLNRNFIGCDIKQEYVDIANKRLAQVTLNTIQGGGGNSSHN